MTELSTSTEQAIDGQPVVSSEGRYRGEPGPPVAPGETRQWQVSGFGRAVAAIGGDSLQPVCWERWQGSLTISAEGTGHVVGADPLEEFTIEAQAVSVAIDVPEEPPGCTSTTTTAPP